MNYCILIELSQTQVTFSAYTGGEGGFVPYGEVNRPLAVWFSGNNMVIGKDAQKAALSNQPNAFTNLFQQMKSRKQFNYANETHEYNKLLLFTLRAGLREFFVQNMYNSQGSLEDNVAYVPLLLMFGPDMDDSSCAVVMSQLKDNGFGNVRRVYENEYILRYLSYQSQPEAKVILSSDGSTLYGEWYESTKKECSFLLPNAGKDPRVDKLLGLIWERSEAMYHWLSFENEKKAIMEVANRFIQSGESTVNSNLQLSDGNLYPYYLDKSDLSLLNNTTDAQVLNALNRNLNGIDKENCCVVLKGMAMNNKYLYELLVSEYPHVVRLDDSQQKVALQQLLDECKQMNFDFAQATSVKVTPTEPLPASIIPTKPCYPSEPLGEDPQTVPEVDASRPSQPVVPSGMDKREFRMLKANVLTCQKNGKNAQAKAEIAAFRQQMHDKGVFDFDQELEAMEVQRVDSVQPLKPKNSSNIDANILTHAQPSGKDNQLFRMLKATIQTHIRNGNIAQVKAEIANFRREMHTKNITAFDAELDAIKIKIAKKTGSSQPQSVRSVSSSEVSHSVQLSRVVEPSGKDLQQFRMLSATVKTYLNQGSVAKAQSEIGKFRQQMHEKGITAFKQDLDKLVAQVEGRGIASSSQFPTEHRSAQKGDTDEGTLLMRSGKIQEADEWFRKNGEPAKANECKRLKLWMRFIVPYKNDIVPTAKSHNRTKAVSRAKEIEEYIAIYKRYGMDASDLVEMVNAYKKIY